MTNIGRLLLGSECFEQSWIMLDELSSIYSWCYVRRYFFIFICSIKFRVAARLLAGGHVFDFLQKLKTFIQRDQTGSGAHPTTYSVRSRGSSFDLRLVVSLRISGALSSLPAISSWCVKGLTCGACNAVFSEFCYLAMNWSMKRKWKDAMIS